MVRWLQRENVHFWRSSRFVSVVWLCHFTTSAMRGGWGQDRTTEQKDSNQQVLLGSAAHCWFYSLSREMCHWPNPKVCWAELRCHQPSFTATFWVQFSSVEECSVSLPQDSTLPLQLSHSLVSTCICSGNRRKSQCFVVKLTDSSVCTSGC